MNTKRIKRRALRVRHLNVQIEKKLSREKSINNCNFPADSNIKLNKKPVILMIKLNNERFYELEVNLRTNNPYA